MVEHSCVFRFDILDAAIQVSIEALQVSIEVFRTLGATGDPEGPEPHPLVIEVTDS